MKFVGGITYGPNTFTFPQTFSAQIISTITTGTAPFSVASTTNVANLNASSLNGATFASPSAIGSTAASTGAFTTLSASGQTTLTNASGYNLYASGAGNNYMAGSLGIGNPSGAGQMLYVNKNTTGSTSTAGVAVSTAIQSDVTGQAALFSTYVLTQAATFNLAALKHYNANQGAFGAGSSVNIQSGYFADASLTGATNNYGFFGAIASGTGRYNLYMGGTADNYMAGSLGIGSTPAVGSTLFIQKSITGATTGYSIRNIGTVQSDVTTEGIGIFNSLSTQAASFTLPTYEHFYASQGTIGAGSAITSQYGFYTGSNLTGATNNYGFVGTIASGTGRYNLYMGGTAANYLAGDLQLSKTVTAAGTTGARTINTTTGTVNFAATATSLVVTNSLVTANSIIIATVGTNDTTMKSVQAVAAAGSFTLYANVAATAETRVNFHITN